LGRLSGAVSALLAGWDAYADAPGARRLKVLARDVGRLAEVLAECERRSGR
jgi:hypothetical protein